MGKRTGRRFVSVALLAIGLAACGGGGGDDEQASDAEATVAGGPVVDLDPCDLLRPDDAEALSGAAVEEVDDAPPTSLASVIGCTYRAVDGGGSAIAASLVLGVAEEEGRAANAIEAELASFEETDAVGLDVEVAGADEVRALRTPEVVLVLYAVEDVVVRVQVVPDGGVTDDDVEAVLDFTETTVEPVREAFEEKERREREDGGGTATTAAEGDEAAADGDEVVQQGEIAGLWSGDWGTMAIEVDGDQVRAAYTHDDGRITGTFEDGVFRGRWTEIPSREGPSDAGSVEFRFAKTDDDDLALDGRWDYDSDPEPLTHEDWDLTLSEEAVPEELLEAFADDASFDEP